MAYTNEDILQFLNDQEPPPRPAPAPETKATPAPIPTPAPKSRLERLVVPLSLGFSLIVTAVVVAVNELLITRPR